MFRVNQTEWINPRLIGVEHVRICECAVCVKDSGVKDCFYVNISTKDGETYSSEYFDTFVDAENFVQSLVDMLN